MRAHARTRRDLLARPAPLVHRAWSRMRRAGGTMDRWVREITSERGLAILCLVALVVAGAIMRIWALGGTSFALGSDESRYVAVAQNLASGRLPDGNAQWFGARAVFVWPVAFLFKVAGATDYTAVAWPFFISLISIIACYLVAREITGRRQAVVAAGIVAMAPVEVLMATHLRPDAVMPAFVALAVWAALRTRTSTHTRAWLVAVGVFIGAGWASRETALLMVPVVVVAAWPTLRSSWRRVAQMIAGLLMVPLIEVVVFAFAGRPLWPLTAAGAASSLRTPAAGLENGETFVVMLGSEWLHSGSLVFLALPIVLLAVVIGIVRRQHSIIVPLAWLIVGYAVLEIGAIVSVDAPTRFLTLLTVPVALLIAIAFDCRVSPVLIAAVAVVTVLAIQPRIDRSATDTNVRLVSEVAGVLHDLPRAPILAADYIWWAKLNAFVPSGTLTVDRVVDPAYLSDVGRGTARRLDLLPDVAEYRGGYVVTGPVTPIDGWPTNWKAFAAQMKTQVPWARLEPIAHVGGATVWRWNK